MKEVIQEGLTSVPLLVENLRLRAKGIPALKELCWLEQEGRGLTVWAVFGDCNKDHLFAFSAIEWDLRRQAMDQGTPLGEIEVILGDLNHSSKNA